MTTEQYSERDIIALDASGNHFCRHIKAMTSEGLHDKADLTAEQLFTTAKANVANPSMAGYSRTA
jgi:hypothetical protein